MKNIKAKLGDSVKVHYVGTLEDGQIFDSSYEREQPIDITVGQETILAGFSNAIVDMQAGETKDFTLSPEHAYGEVREDLFRLVSEESMGLDRRPEVGEGVTLTLPEGKYPATVHQSDENGVILDFNHPLAGKTLNFKVELLELDQDSNQSGDQLG